jgi:nucleoside-diphosphate-sugar epimerase
VIDAVISVAFSDKTIGKVINIGNNFEISMNDLAKKIIEGVEYLKIAPTLVNCARDVSLPSMSLDMPKKPDDLSAIYAMKEEYGLGASVDRLIAALNW